MSLRISEVVEMEAIQAAGICAPRVAGNLACRRPFRPPGGLKARLQPRIGCHTAALRLQEFGVSTRQARVPAPRRQSNLIKENLS
jgi:hypothetical protein